MKQGITYIRFVEQEVRIGTNKNTSWKGSMKYNLEQEQINLLRKYVVSQDLADLGHFLNYPIENNRSSLIVMELLWAFSKNKSINVVADDRYAENRSKKGIKEINKMLIGGRNSSNT